MTDIYNTIIAIDPDVGKSGVALLDTSARTIKTMTMTFPELMDTLQHCRDAIVHEGKSILVVVEAGWLNQSHWHLTARDSTRIAAAKGNAAGRNHETGRKIVEMARHYGLHVEEAKPLRKRWKGKDGKITHEELARLLERKHISGLGKTSNQDMRDSIILSISYSKI